MRRQLRVIQIALVSLLAGCAAEDEQIADCGECLPGVTIALRAPANLPAGNYAITVEANGQTLSGAIDILGPSSAGCASSTCFSDCTTSLCGRIQTTADRRGLTVRVDNGIGDNAGPSRLKITIDSAGQRLAVATVLPTYVESLANGSECPGSCMTASAEIALAMPNPATPTR